MTRLRSIAHSSARAAVPSGLAFCLLAIGPSPASQEDLAALLRRAGEAVVRQTRESVVILGDERCHQTAFDERPFGFTAGTVASGGGHVKKGQRRWLAELALVQITSRSVPAVPWIEVRDVIEVDGKPIPDREGRLAALFQPGQPMTAVRVRAIVQENARYNIGPVQRTVNAPTIPLLVLHPDNQGRFLFTWGGEKKLDGVLTVKVTFQEARSPTLVRSADEGADMPSAGALWIDRETGEVRRAEMLCGESGETRLNVAYVRHPSFEVMVPRELEENARAQGTSWVEGRCEYSNFRRFETRARLLVPKTP
jgi:hypothetical protein